MLQMNVGGVHNVTLIVDLAGGSCNVIDPEL